MGTESPVMFGMHPNAEIGFRTDQSNTLYSILADLSGGSDGGGGGGGSSMVERVQGLMEEIQVKLAQPEPYPKSERVPLPLAATLKAQFLTLTWPRTS